MFAIIRVAFSNIAFRFEFTHPSWVISCLRSVYPSVMRRASCLAACASNLKVALSASQNSRSWFNSFSLASATSLRDDDCSSLVV